MRKTLLVTLLIALLPTVQAQKASSAAKLQALLNQINNHYVDSVNEEKLVDQAIVAMLEELDPHSIYIPKKDLEQVNEPLVGNFEGVGIQFNIMRDTIYVVDAISGGPSERLGIRAGDRIIRVDTTSVAGVGVKNADVMKLLRGKKGSKVNVKVKRGSSTELLEFLITRDKIPIHSVESAYMADPTTGYIKVSRFGSTTTEEFREKLDLLLAQGMKDLILDLQGNGGGYMRSALEMADELLPKRKLIVYTEGRTSPRDNNYATDKGRFEKGRVVVLVDEGSASASEIVSGAVQDWDRGVIIGRRSFGKGLVQRPITLPDGSVVRLTVSRYYTPSGRSIQKPYADGKEAYARERAERLMKGELTTSDSIHPNDTVRYFTAGKRVVYGGGGIMPDVFVPIDTTLSSLYFSRLVRKGVLNSFALDHVDRNREALKALYPNVEVFRKNFSMDEKLTAALVAHAEAEAIEADPDGLARSKALIDLRIKALIARDLWDTSAYWQVINPENPVDASYAKALEYLRTKNFKRMGFTQ